MKPAAWVGLVIIVAALAFGAKSFVTNLTPYVTFAQARQTKTGSVQVMGGLDKTTISYGHNELNFTLISPEGARERLPVRFKASRPANFEEAVQVTAIGHYDGETFQADNLLVKCPSKYQGKEREYDGGKPAGQQSASVR